VKQRICFVWGLKKWLFLQIVLFFSGMPCCTAILPPTCPDTMGLGGGSATQFWIEPSILGSVVREEFYEIHQ
jgi:hypothetical protein